MSSAFPAPAAPPAPDAPRNGFGVTALVLGIVGTILGFIPLLAIPALILGILALVFGVLALLRVRSKRASNRGVSLAGTVLGVLATVLGIVGVAIVSSAVDDLDDSLKGDTYESKTEGAKQEQEGTKPKQENAPAKDVRMAKPRISPDEFTGYVPLTVTNHTDERRDYMIKVEFTKGGERLATADAYVDSVRPGQTVQEKAQILEDDEVLVELQNAAVKINKIERTKSF